MARLPKEVTRTRGSNERRRRKTIVKDKEEEEKEEEALMREIEGGECEFEKSMTGLQLLPIAFISQRQPLPSSRHSFVGEALTGRWAMLKFKRYLLSREFTWITDCSGLTKFFETDYVATHTIQHWKLKLF